MEDEVVRFVDGDEHSFYSETIAENGLIVVQKIPISNSKKLNREQSNRSLLDRSQNETDNVRNSSFLTSQRLHTEDSQHPDDELLVETLEHFKRKKQGKRNRKARARQRSFHTTKHLSVDICPSDDSSMIAMRQGPGSIAGQDWKNESEKGVEVVSKWGRKGPEQSVTWRESKTDNCFFNYNGGRVVDKLQTQSTFRSEVQDYSCQEELPNSAVQGMISNPKFDENSTMKETYSKKGAGIHKETSSCRVTAKQSIRGSNCLKLKENDLNSQSDLRMNDKEREFQLEDQDSISCISGNTYLEASIGQIGLIPRKFGDQNSRENRFQSMVPTLKEKFAKLPKRNLNEEEKEESSNKKDNILKTHIYNNLRGDKEALNLGHLREEDKEDLSLILKKRSFDDSNHKDGRNKENEGYPSSNLLDTEDKVNISKLEIIIESLQTKLEYFKQDSITARLENKNLKRELSELKILNKINEGVIKKSFL